MTERGAYTIQEYLGFEREAHQKHEYRNGEIVAMSGGTARHSRIITRVLTALERRLEGTPCVPYEGNMRVRVARKAVCCYPDISVICGPPQFDPDDPEETTVLNPRVIVEVPSPSTESYDRGDKFTNYREIDSFEEYLLIAQDKPSVEAFLRRSRGAWSLAPYSGLDAVVKARCLGLEIPMEEIYRGIEFPSA